MTAEEKNTNYNDGVGDVLHLVKSYLIVQMVPEDHPIKVVLKELVEKIPGYFKYPNYNTVLNGIAQTDETKKL